MQSTAKTPAAYIDSLAPERQEVIRQLRKEIMDNLSQGFEEVMTYGMIGYVVPCRLYTKGYLNNAKIPLPFMNLVSQKNFVAVYHMGIYCDAGILKWFTDAYAKAGVGKLDMGKSCIRFKNLEKIPYALIGELASKMTAEEWISRYDALKSKK